MFGNNITIWEINTVIGPQGWDSWKNVTGRWSERLRISFLEAVYGFRVSFLSLTVCSFLGNEFDVMAVIVSDHSLEYMYVCVWKEKTLYFLWYHVLHVCIFFT